MIPSVTLSGFGVETTALGLGCAGLFRLPTRSERARVLDAAYANGIRHFDVAPMYGLGIAERELGRFLKSRREETIVATKFGIAPTRTAHAIAHFQGPMRRLFRRASVLRERARSSGAGPSSGWLGNVLYTGRGYDAAAARMSLEHSLRELGTDYLDLFLLHDPAPDDVRGDDVYEYLENARGSGLLRSWGVAGEPEATLPIARWLRDRPFVFQVRDDVFLRSTTKLPRDGRHTVITYGVLGRAVPRILDFLTEDDDRRRRWNERVGANCADAETLAMLLLRDALHQNSSGAVLFSTVHPSRISLAAEAGSVDRLMPDPQVGALRELVERELKSQRAP